jgi:hypothetical protein
MMLCETCDRCGRTINYQVPTPEGFCSTRGCLNIELADLKLSPISSSAAHPSNAPSLPAFASPPPIPSALYLQPAYSFIIIGINRFNKDMELSQKNEDYARQRLNMPLYKYNEFLESLRHIANHSQNNSLLFDDSHLGFLHNFTNVETLEKEISLEIKHMFSNKKGEALEQFLYFMLEGPSRLSGLSYLKNGLNASQPAHAYYPLLLCLNSPEFHAALASFLENLEKDPEILRMPVIVVLLTDPMFPEQQHLSSKLIKKYNIIVASSDANSCYQTLVLYSKQPPFLPPKQKESCLLM